jgi:carbonic anhydrase
MFIENIFQNNEKWAANKSATDPEYFTRLASGQSPDALYIGCSDSRVTAEEMLGAEPGDLFVLRNIANLVPNTDLSSMSVINFAVEHLKVKHIFVCGHYGCGGVKAAMNSANLGVLNPWLRNIRDVYRLHIKELNAIEGEDARYNRLIELNVQEQCVNVMKTAEVQCAYRRGELTIHGWVFDVSTGRVMNLNLDFPRILERIREIYHLD